VEQVVVEVEQAADARHDVLVVLGRAAAVLADEARLAAVEVAAAVVEVDLDRDEGREPAPRERGVAVRVERVACVETKSSTRLQCERIRMF